MGLILIRTPKVSLSSQSMSTWLGCVAIMTRIRAIAHMDRNATLKAEIFLVQPIQRISGWNVRMSFEGELSDLIVQWKMSVNSLSRERKGKSVTHETRACNCTDCAYRSISTFMLKHILKAPPRDQRKVLRSENPKRMRA